MGAKILIADDESDIVSMLGSFFESKGFRVLPAFNGAEALKQVEKQPDIILLDINMPGKDGLEVCKRIRDHISCPILFLTARIEDTDKVKGFTVGGDDYIVKPFSLMELEARVRAHLRREARHNFEAQVKFSGDLTIDYSERCLFFGDKRVGLAKKEFDIVELLSQNPGQIFDKERIYGYIKDPNDPKHWIVDDEAAQVVRRVYSMTLEGFGTEQIAAQLEKDGVLTPRAYWLTKGIKRPGKGKQQPPTKWNSSTITKILSLQEYCGDILNFKTYSKSYKNKKRIDNDRENWVVFQDVHEAIIERAVYEQVQQKRGKIRKRRTNNGEHNMFSGLLVCADCGSNLHFHFNQGNPEIKYFNCSNYKGNRGTCTSTHYVRVDFLEEVVLGEIRRLTKFASLYEDEFVKAVIGHSQQAEQTDRKLKEKELKTLLARDEELDGLFERIYEDNVSGKLSDDRFAKMSRRYEDEQKELAEKIKKLRSEIEKQSSRSMTTDMFIGLVRKYTRARKLTPRMLNELIEKIEVFNAEKIDGVWEQRLRIHYNCVGTIEIPTVLPLPIPEVSVNTRKGVVVNYAPCELAV